MRNLQRMEKLEKCNGAILDFSVDQLMPRHKVGNFAIIFASGVTTFLSSRCCMYSRLFPCTEYSNLPLYSRVSSAFQNAGTDLKYFSTADFVSRLYPPPEIFI